jgi:16S rRNA (cytosine967-C5)-methyltransferase
MKLSSLIGHASELLQVVRSTEKPADSVIDTFFRSRRYLGSHDRRFIAESTYGTLRHLRKCEALLRHALGDFAGAMIPEDGFLLLVVAYLVGVEQRTAIEVADLQETVKSHDLKPHLSSVLQSLAASRHSESADLAERIGEEYSYPDWMVRRFLNQYGEEETLLLCESLNGQGPPEPAGKFTQIECRRLSGGLEAGRCSDRAHQAFSVRTGGSQENQYLPASVVS